MNVIKTNFMCKGMRRWISHFLNKKIQPKMVDREYFGTSRSDTGGIIKMNASKWAFAEFRYSWRRTELFERPLFLLKFVCTVVTRALRNLHTHFACVNFDYSHGLASITAKIDLLFVNIKKKIIFWFFMYIIYNIFFCRLK